MPAEKSITTIVNIEAEENVAEEAPKGKVVKKSGKRIGFNYIIYKSLKENRKNDVMKCIYIKGLFNFGTCVIKEGTLGDSTDKHGRDIKDRLVWQKELHKKLQGKVRVPRYLGSFEENGNYYLVIEHIKGESLVHTFRKHNKELRESLITRNKLGQKFLGYLLKIIDLLEVLHKHHVVHRDASSNNFMITPGGKIALIDLELSYSLDQQFPSPPFQLGTHGFMSPQQIATLPPTPAEDIFALGAIIFQMWTYISPSKIVDTYYPEFIKRINFFIPDQHVANIVSQCMHPVAENRPALSVIRKVIQEYKASRPHTKRPQCDPYLYNRQEILAVIQQSIETYSTPWLADPDKGWFADNAKESARDNEKINKSWFGSFNQGAAGVIYMLSIARSVGIDIDTTLPFIQKGLDLIQQKYIDRKISSSPGLHFGAAGIAATVMNALQSGLIALQPKYIDWIHALLDKDNKGLDILNGISGQGIANMICDPVITDKQLRERTHSYVQQLLSQQQDDGCWRTAPKSQKKKVAKGFLIGISGIVYFLLEYAQLYNDKLSLEAALRGLKWLTKGARQNKASIYWPSSTGKKKKHSSNTWWALGTAGIALAFIKAYALTHDTEHQKFATRILNAHKEREITNGLSQANGLSGLGEVYLEAYQTFKDPIWLEKADWVAQHIIHLQKVHPKHGPYWLTEHEKQPAASFTTGNSGILHFLLRYCYPDKIGFPMTVFHQSETAVQISKLVTQTQSV